MCKVLKISRASVYYQAKPRKDYEDMVHVKSKWNYQSVVLL
jgi:hypothetical protein